MKLGDGDLSNLRGTGAIAREWKSPAAERVVSMPVFTVLTMLCRPSTFCWGERLVLSALAVYGSSSFLDMMFVRWLRGVEVLCWLRGRKKAYICGGSVRGDMDTDVAL